MRARLAAVVIGLVAAGLGGCGNAKNTAAHSDPSKVKRVTSQLEFGDTINYGAFGTNTEVDCADGKSLNVGGSNNTLKVKGDCTVVSIAGADNRITLNKVDRSLTITGLNNAVTYRTGEPKVDDRGSGNTVRRR